MLRATKVTQKNDKQFRQLQWQKSNTKFHQITPLSLKMPKHNHTHTHTNSLIKIYQPDIARRTNKSALIICYTKITRQIVLFLLFSFDRNCQNHMNEKIQYGKEFCVTQIPK